ncbi:MAG: nitroreductase family protein [Flavobacteriales bacterium]
MSTSFIELSKERYSTKKYKDSEVVSSEHIAELKEILRMTPSSINSQPWKFTFVSNSEIKSQLAKVSFFNEQKINEASHLVVFSVVDDLDVFEAQIQKHLPAGAVGYYQQFLKPKDQKEIKSWLEHQLYISLGFFLSACATMGIDSTPMEGIQSEAYASILKQDGYKPLFAVSIGYGHPEDPNHPTKRPKSRIPMDEVVVEI